MFKFAGRAQAHLTAGQYTVFLLTDDPFLPGNRAQGISVSYPLIFPIHVYALATYLNVTVPSGVVITCYVLKNGVATAIENAYVGSSGGGVQTWYFSPGVVVEAGDRLDLALMLDNQFGTPWDYAAECSATLGYIIPS